jgi:hypothetical protein
MIVLHPYSTNEPKRKAETRAFLASVANSYNIVHRNIDAPMAYPDLLREFWDQDDLVILEDDKVPAARDLTEIISCAKPACCFPYPVSFYFYTPMSLWTDHFPYSLGFVRFSKEVQHAVPSSVWYVEGKHWGLDAMVEKPIIAKFGPIHLHPRFIKHNHGNDPIGKLKGLKYQLSQMIRSGTESA